MKRTTGRELPFCLLFPYRRRTQSKDRCWNENAGQMGQESYMSSYNVWVLIICNVADLNSQSMYAKNGGFNVNAPSMCIILPTCCRIIHIRLLSGPFSGLGARNSCVFVLAVWYMLCRSVLITASCLLTRWSNHLTPPQTPESKATPFMEPSRKLEDPLLSKTFWWLFIAFSLLGGGAKNSWTTNGPKVRFGSPAWRLFVV